MGLLTRDLIVFHFVGDSGTGKTTALTDLAREIKNSRLGKVGSLKHIHDPKFTIDTKGKDTWKHATSGASVVVALSRGELIVMKKSETPGWEENLSAKEILQIFKRESVDYLLIEGLAKKFGGMKNFDRILCASSSANAARYMRNHPSILKYSCITGKIANSSRESKEKQLFGIPVLNVRGLSNFLLESRASSKR